ncbi:MAG: deoxyribonuclease IV [Thermoplasmatota archaeon]
MILGAHVSTAGGIQNSVDNAEEIGCTSFQVFTKNQRQWIAPPLREEDVSAFRERLGSSGLGPVLSHGSYLMNLSNPKPTVFERSKKAVIDELERCHLLDIPYFVMHPGSHLGRGVKAGVERMVQGMDDIFFSFDGPQIILLETTAGQGTNLGSRFEHLIRIIEGCSFPERLGICFDTCHTYTAGYNIRSRGSYEETMEEFGSVIGMGRLKAVHLNDTEMKLGSGKDRHASIGQGEIGTEGFSNLVNDRKLKDIPGILETPGGPEGYRKDLNVLRGLSAG